MDSLTNSDADELDFLSKAWWLPVVFGVLLLLYSFVVLSFTIKTVYAVSIALGIGLLMAGMAQLAMWRQATHWRLLLLLAGIFDLCLAVVAFAWPESTFVVLARLVGWVLIIHGVIDIVRAFEERGTGEDGWWATLLVGLFSIVVAVWAIRYPGREVALLVLWVGIAVMVRGIVLIVFGFNLRRLRPGGAVVLA